MIDGIHLQGNYQPAVTCNHHFKFVHYRENHKIIFHVIRLKCIFGATCPVLCWCVPTLGKHNENESEQTDDPYDFPAGKKKQCFNFSLANKFVLKTGLVL